MEQQLHFQQCPVCHATDAKFIFEAKDYTVSGESFGIYECQSCSLRFTQDAPDATAIVPYYKSENYISHTNTSKGLINRLYQFVRTRTLAGKRKLVEHSTGLSTGRLLDVGAGTGAFLHEMKKKGWEITGLEPDMDARQKGKQDFAVDLSDLAVFYQLEKSAYDAITLWHVLEHVHDLQKYVAHLKELLNEKGKLFIAVPNYTSKDAVIYQQYWAAYDVPRHLYHFSPAAMQVLMEKNGLKIEARLPMWYDSFYVSMLSSRYKNGKTHLLAAFINGCRSNLAAWGDIKKCSSVIYVIRK